MNKEIKEKWISTLRSGMYKQGWGFLKARLHKNNDYQYCCLGVLTEIVKPQNFGTEEYYDEMVQIRIINRWYPSESGLTSTCDQCRAAKAKAKNVSVAESSVCYHNARPILVVDIADSSNSGYFSSTEIGEDIINICELQPDDLHSLMLMNDNGKSFDEIAKWIQETL